MRAGQPRGEAGAGVAGKEGAADARAGRDVGGAGEGAGGVGEAGEGIRRRTHQPLRAGRRAAGGGPRRDEGGDGGPGLWSGAGVRNLRGYDRGDRRVRVAGALGLGNGLPGGGDRGLRAHARAAGRVAEQHDQHRHRLRFRRGADGAALPGEGAGFGAGGARVHRAGASFPKRRGSSVDAAGAGRSARYRRRQRQADRGHAPARAGHRPRGERGGGAGGDESLCGRSEVADLPAADDGSGGG